MEKLIGRNANGFPVYFNDLETDYIRLCHDLLGVVPPTDEIRFKCKVTMSWFRGGFGDLLSIEATNIEMEQQTHVVILYCLNSRLFAEHLKRQCNLKYLPLLRDF